MDELDPPATESLRRLARGLLYDRGRSEDLVQEAWLAASSSACGSMPSWRASCGTLGRAPGGRHALPGTGVSQFALGSGRRASGLAPVEVPESGEVHALLELVVP